MRRWLALVVTATLGAPASPARAQLAPKLPKSVALPDLPTALKNVEATYSAPANLAGTSAGPAAPAAASSSAPPLTAGPPRP